MSASQVTYVVGQNKKVHDILSQRTAGQSAAYFLPYLEPTFKLLDVGCGPGSISCDLAQILHLGHVTGVDQSEDAVKKSQETATGRSINNITFQRADATNLPFPDAAFDAVHAHQLLLHIPKSKIQDVLREMKRVTKPRGVIACRDSIWDTRTIYPYPPPIERWFGVTKKIMDSGLSDRNAGAKTHAWAKEAGLKVEFQGASSNLHPTSTFKERTLLAVAQVPEGSRAVKSGFWTEDEEKEAVDAWREWGENEDAWYAVMCGEIVCRV